MWDSRGRTEGHRVAEASTSLKKKVHPILLESWEPELYFPQHSQFVFRDLSCVAHMRANSVSHTEPLLQCSPKMTSISYSPYCIRKVTSTESSVWVPHSIDLYGVLLDCHESTKGKTYFSFLFISAWWWHFQTDKVSKSFYIYICSTFNNI